MALLGSLTEPISGGSSVVRMTAWSGARDALGRMTGRFSYAFETFFNTGKTSASSYEAELRDVMRAP